MSPDITRISAVVRQSALAWPDRIALENLTGSARVSYAELWSAVERGAAVLRGKGLEPGDRILLAAETGPEWMTAFLSISHAGLVVVPIPVTTPEPLVRLVVQFAGVRACVRNRITADGAPDLQVRGDAELHAGAGQARPLRSPDSSTTAVLVFTSGSTSRPRAVALSHAALRANLRSLQAVRAAAPDEALLSTLPPSHAYELVAGQLAPLAVGARVVYAGTPLPNRLVDAIRTRSITRMLLVPALFEALVHEVIDGLIATGLVDDSCRHVAPLDLAARVRRLSPDALARLRAAVRERIGPSLRTVTLGGAASNPAWAVVLAAMEIDLDVGYGLTEAGPVVAMGRASECPAGSVGRPVPGVEVRIGMDDEVLVRTDAAMEGYAGDVPATTAAFEGQWLRTGDRGWLDDSGFLFITGRIKEAMVTASGETIYPDEIEPYYQSPLFAELAVVPVTGADGNDEPTLVVVPAGAAIDEGAIRRAVDALRAAAPARLRVSGVICWRIPLPRTAVGKIRRRALADELDRGTASPGPPRDGARGGPLRPAPLRRGAPEGAPSPEVTT